MTMTLNRKWKVMNAPNAYSQWLLDVLNLVNNFFRYHLSLLCGLHHLPQDKSNTLTTLDLQLYFCGKDCPKSLSRRLARLSCALKEWAFPASPTYQRTWPTPTLTTQDRNRCHGCALVSIDQPPFLLSQRRFVCLLIAPPITKESSCRYSPHLCIFL